jgi:putative hemolysin
MKRTISTFLNVLLLGGILVAMVASTPPDTNPPRSAPPTAQAGVHPNELQTIREPAAVYCSELGYEYRILQDPDGSQHGVCKLPDHTTCDAWDFLAGRCGQQHNACMRHGLDTVTRPDSGNPFSKEAAICVDADGEVKTSAADMVNLIEVATGNPSMPPATEPETPTKHAPDAETRDAATPSSFDWRAYSGANWMTPVKNQGMCGSCWAFSAVGVAEAVTKIGLQDHTMNPDLSEQYLVTDCASNVGDCAGGYKGAALTYIMDYGVPDESCLPYHDGDSPTGCSTVSGACDCTACTYCGSNECSDYRCSDRCGDWYSRLSSLENVQSLSGASRDEIKEALVTHGPIAVSMYMGGSFDNGVYRCSSATSTNHAVVIVGYDDAGGYWIVRNSWGSSWNGDGYFDVAYGNCLIERYPYYADLVVVCNDPNEPNDSANVATSIVNKQTINATICPSGDNDFYAFTHNKDTHVVIDIDARSAGSTLDSYIYLLDSDGTTVLAQNDDADGYDSYLEYTLPHDGTYYIRVRDYSHRGGPEYTYAINVLLVAQQDFGYGVSVTLPDGEKAAEMELDWIKVYDPPSTRQPTHVLYRAKAGASDWYDLNALSARLRGIAQTYGANIDAYEIGNEVNTLTEWGAPPDASHYVDVLCAARLAILEEDPTAKIISAGLAPTGRVAGSWDGHTGHDGTVQDDREYLPEFLDHGGNLCADAIGYHPMGFSADYAAAPDVDGGTSETDCTDGLCFRSAAKIYEILENRGLAGTKIWATEVGWIREPPAACLSHPSWQGRQWQIVSPEKQGQNLAGAFSYARQHWPWMEALFVFNLDFSAAPYYPDCEQMRYYSILGTPAETALIRMIQGVQGVYLPLVRKNDGP